MELLTIAFIISVIVIIIGMIIIDIALPLSIMMLIVGGIVLIISLCGSANLRAEEEESQRASQLTELAKECGAPEFCPTIGTVNSKFCIDTVHSLFATEYVEDTISKIVVAPISYILTCSLEEETETVSNAKSRTIAGGILAGTTGAIAGAVSAKEHEQPTGNYILTITTNISYLGTRYYSVSRDFGLQVVHYLKG